MTGKIKIKNTAVLLLVAIWSAFGQLKTEKLETKAGPLTIHFIGHASLIFEFNKQVIHIDPWSKKADYSKLPRADVILITHAHPDHLDMEAIKQIQKESTKIYSNPAGAAVLKKANALKNYDEVNMGKFSFKALPAYNLIHKRDNGEFFHPKGDGNGYLFSFGDSKILVAGDTENIPELKELNELYAAFLPMNLPYTMTPEMVADLVYAIKPKILFPYHTGKTDKTELSALLKDLKGVDVRMVEGM